MPATLLGPGKRPCKPRVHASANPCAPFIRAVKPDKRTIKGISFKKLMIHLVANRGICGNNAKSFSYLWAPPSLLI
ncbi:MAG: hypothetical protein B7Y07_00065 [Halothiobacillus sp. 24-54-40]|nr:MAG: hypothetical protein B7Y58_00060 [Halothiobacillus sp. 35-54-62]OYY56318.1 MAG: hypothetical protein B7Y53_02050 [Halothiobacillus sp. 28-55-5]OYZ88367.1 MAG: hypothetical protein B7Y07_00065 [Halothiobacillus sp. 24-54-40]OZA81675.1 MAG: hypothetical protein B7X64_00075 [Halothiobacillus sp. 39-53-45]